MAMRKIVLRSRAYLRQHGLKSSFVRVVREVQNSLFHGRLVIYGLDLIRADFDGWALPAGCRVERYDKSSGMPDRLYKRIAESYSEELLRDYIQRRFDKGALLWCLMNETEEIGYLWSIDGRCMKPHYYFPMMTGDVHLDDGYVFPPFRGQGMFSILNYHIFRYYKKEGFSRIYEEIAEWNSASMKAAVKHGFIRTGMAKMRIRRNKSRVTWWYKDIKDPSGQGAD